MNGLHLIRQKKSYSATAKHFILSVRKSDSYMFACQSIKQALASLVSIHSQPKEMEPFKAHTDLILIFF